MSTYFVQGSTMDAIADAINAKTGGSSALTPAQMVTAIGAISGGFPLSGVKMASGSFTVASPAGGSITINHGLSKTPFMVIVMPTENALISTNKNLGGVGISCKQPVNNKYYAGARFYSNADKHAYSHNPNTEPNDIPDTTYIHGFTSTTFEFTSSATFPPLPVEYQWVALAFKGA